jgi:hypothetical protein
MSLRRLALVCGLTLADYLLWNSSLSGNHEVVALVSGLTLPFLLLASTVLVALTLARLISGSVRFGSVRRSRQQAGGPGPGTGHRHQRRVRRHGAAARLLRRSGQPAAGPPSPDPSSGSVSSGSVSSGSVPSGSVSSGSVPSVPASPASTARQRAA